MRVTKKRLALGTMLGVVFILLFSLNSFAYVNCNGSGGSYGGGSNSDGTSSVSSFDAYLIETYIIEGAGYYLEANTAFQQLLGMVELQDFQGLDMTKYGDTLRNAIFSMENAKASYDLLIQAAETTPYNPEVQEKLAAFDYAAFGEENGLISEVIKKVGIFLKPGNVTGVFKENRTSFESILDRLDLIESEFSIGRVAGIDSFWKLNETFSEINLFGSYVARIFSKINN